METALIITLLRVKARDSGARCHDFSPLRGHEVHPSEAKEVRGGEQMAVIGINILKTVLRRAGEVQRVRGPQENRRRGGLRDSGLLESALARPRQLFAYGKPAMTVSRPLMPRASSRITHFSMAINAPASSWAPLFWSEIATRSSPRKRRPSCARWPWPPVRCLRPPTRSG